MTFKDPSRPSNIIDPGDTKKRIAERQEQILMRRALKDDRDLADCVQQGASRLGRGKGPA